MSKMSLTLPSSPHTLFRRHSSTIPYSSYSRLKTVTKSSLLAVPVVALLGSAGFYLLQDARERRKIRGTFNGFKRFFRTMASGALITADYKYNLHGLVEDSPAYDAAITGCHTRSAERVLQTCLANGGLYIKMGQGLSAVGQANFVPREYATTLQVLQDKVLSFRPTELDELFLEDFGVAPETLFSKLDRTPIAAASLAQVFRATTMDGRDVAVKCQYIDLRDRYSGDIRTVGLVLEFLHWIFPEFMGNWIFNEIKDTLALELDFIKEGRNSEKCARDLANLSYLYVPKVLWSLTSPRVLTTEFIDNAAKITDVDRIKKMALSINDINQKLLTIFGEQIFRSGFVHADPHPGNIFVRRHNGKAQIVLLDHGLYETIPDAVRVNICHVYKATVMGDHINMKKYSDLLGMPDYLMFAQVLVQRPLGQIGRRLLGMKKDLSKKDFDQLRKEMDGHVEKAVATVKAMPKSLYLVMRNMNLVRAICVVHGNPIDRYTIFSRIAAKTAALDPVAIVAVPTVYGRASAAMEFAVFEWNLLLYAISSRMLLMAVTVMRYFGWMSSHRTTTATGFLSDAKTAGEHPPAAMPL
ncbi:putative aarF domain-containing protein kinase 5 [Hypsibius exemplaris]|uniref:AarF domain-containing protein kinase 5 n=1 Tax=Hypsibius exemplaris TaxID=2072580 RepID=A0A1W0WWI4_HYPEX|nr:putative aarF domain-containing protein kinase 5 [Hypsibius exemplaris]